VLPPHGAAELGVALDRGAEGYHLRPGHFVQALEPVELIELSPVRAHDVTLAAISRNLSQAAALSRQGS
jgi:hypothetical protein